LSAAFEDAEFVVIPDSSDAMGMGGTAYVAREGYRLPIR
jgi:hypothetical protein